MVVTLNSLSPPKTIENKNLKHVFFALKHCLKTFFFKTKFDLIGVYWVPKACIGRGRVRQESIQKARKCSFLIYHKCKFKLIIALNFDIIGNNTSNFSLKILHE